MATDPKTLPATFETPAGIPLRPKNVELIDNDDEPLETDWHRLAINLLVDSIYSLFAGRQDFYASGNMFIYFSEEQARNRDYRGPDFFFVWGADPTPLRRYWAIWDENGKFPDVIIELLSPTTAKEDRTTKKDIYERIFKTSDYFCYDPDTETLEGWRLENGRYKPIDAAPDGKLWSESLGLWVGRWFGWRLDRHTTWLRFFTPEHDVVLLREEIQAQRAQAEAERAQAEAERAQTEAERAQTEAERARVEAQRAQVEAERARAEAERAAAAEAEVARLRAELDALRKTQGNVSSSDPQS